MEIKREKIPPALVFQGTVDIARPIYWALKLEKIPVYYLIYDRDDLSQRISSDNVIKIQNGSLDANSIEQILKRTGYFDRKLILFPTNEISLNKCLPLAEYDGGKRFHVPGTVAFPRILDAFGITNKDSFLENNLDVLRGLESNYFRLAKSSILRKSDDLEKFALTVDYYPVTVKPARKGLSDSFTNKLKSKLRVAPGPSQLVAICREFFENHDTPFLIQEKIDNFKEFAWGGMRAKGYCLGAVQFERMKLPPMGGTAVLTEIVSNPKIEEIAKKILSLLDFEGICEIEFLTKNDVTYFTFEVNPRGWLQVDILLSLGLNIYSAYYYLKNDFPWCFDTKDIFGDGRKKVVWSSVDRYVASATKPGVLEALKMLKYDISIKYDNRNRARAALGLIRRVLLKRIKGIIKSDKNP